MKVQNLVVETMGLGECPNVVKSISEKAFALMQKNANEVYIAIKLEKQYR